MQEYYCYRASAFSGEDDAAFELMAAGASGVQIEPLGELLFWWHGNEESRGEFEERIRAIVSLDGQPERVRPDDGSGTVHCPELWEPLAVGAITVRPVQERPSGMLPVAVSPELFITPGTGFGTGHHRTTFSILELLQSSLVREALAPKHATALDLGTGSGILALAIASYYQRTVDAIDNDPLALLNAAHNVEMNQLGRLVRLIEGDVKSAAHGYQLIVANIYAEVLITLSAELATRLSPGGVLILSGIKAELREEVERAFTVRSLHVLQRAERDGWATLLYRA
jgi:ribosomal protein L11 methyltransferase